jgi:hypothetical protein
MYYILIKLKIFHSIKKKNNKFVAGYWWPTPVILATWEAEI